MLVLVVLLRCWNVADVFVEGKTFFVDADCYSRMTRVQRVLEHPGTVIHRHEFENWPEGTQPHTTAPFDYMTAGLAAAIRVFKHDTQTALDLAGAWISPLLGVLTAGFLWFWGGRTGRNYRLTLLFLFAVNPILVHGTVLGRPDHQSLLLLCMAVALGAEVILLERTSRGWAIAGGLAWGLGLWVSLYEPLILLGCALLLSVALRRKGFFVRERLWEGVAMAGVLFCAWLVDGWQVSMPDPVVQAYFVNWSSTIGELRRVNLEGLLQWSGWLLLPSPLILFWLGWKKKDRVVWFWLGMLVVMAVVTSWYPAKVALAFGARWGYFFGLVFTMALPSLLGVFPKRWMAIPVFVVSLWPLLVDWDQRLAPSQRELRAEQRADNLALYEVAQTLRGSLRLPVLAPWWQSPAIAYWSGQPCVAGSSHESLPGTVDASRFYLSTDPAEAEAILARRRVACVIVYDTDRVNSVSSTILGEPARKGSMGEILYEHPRNPPPFLQSVNESPNAIFHAFFYPRGVEQ